MIQEIKRIQQKYYMVPQSKQSTPSPLLKQTMIKRSILVQIRKMTQGESYVAEGGLGNGDIASVGEVSPTGNKKKTAEILYGATIKKKHSITPVKANKINGYFLKNDKSIPAIRRKNTTANTLSLRLFSICTDT